MGDFVTPAAVPKHSTVVERLRQRIEGCRRHHASCESRYQQAQAEQLELERRETISLYQRSLEQRAKKCASHKAQGGRLQDGEQAEHRSSTLIALQETVKRKLDSARSPLNGEQNGICDGSFSPNGKRFRKDGLDTLAGLPNTVPPPVSPLHPVDIKPPPALVNSTVCEELGKNGGLPEVKLNGSLDLDDGFCPLKDLKQEPLDDGAVIDSSDTSLSNQNRLFSDINLNDQEWQELIDELVNTVPEDDMHDLFNEDFEEKKESDFTRPTELIPVPQEPQLPPQAALIPANSPQVPASSAPQFGTPSNSTPPQQSPAMPLASGSPANCLTRSPQTPTPSQTQPTRPGNGFLTSGGNGPPVQGNGPVSVQTSASELSPAEQLKQMAAQQQQRVKLMQQQKQQQSQTANWSPAGAPASPYGGTFNSDKPSSPMMYQQAFNAQNTMGQKMATNAQKPINNYLPQNHITMLNQQSNNLAQSGLNKLSYSNTKPLSHFNNIEHMGQRMTPPMANASKSSMMPYIQSQGTGSATPGAPQSQVQITGQPSHLSEEQKRILLMKQKSLNPSMTFTTMQTHGQEGMVTIQRQPGSVQPSLTGPGGGASAPSTTPGSATSAFLGSPQQAAMMKQMMQMEQEKLVQMHLMEQQQQQQQQVLREQRQQQQQALMAEQLQQQQQQQHLPRQLSQQQRNPFPVQPVSQFQGTQQDVAARSQALQNIRNARLLQQQQQQQQNQGMLQMAPNQTPASMPVSASQSDMSIAYGGQPSGQQGLYGLNPSMNQMLQHPTQGGMGIAHAPVQAQRQPGAGMVGAYGQGMLMNPSVPQQQMKGQTVAKAQRLQTMMGVGGQAVQVWAPQQQQPAMSGRTNGDLVGFTSGPAYGQPRMPKQHFPQPMVDPRALNPAMGGQMMPHMGGQTRTNQPRPVVMGGMSQGVPGMASFSQTGVSGSYMQGGQTQTYQRTPSQDLSYSYANQPTGGGAFSLPDRAEMNSTDGWMDELFLGQ